MLRRTVILLFSAAMLLSAPQVSRGDAALDKLKAGDEIADFRVETVYENETGKTMGARFRHKPSNFVLDLLRIQSVPQAFMWVNSPPPSDQGEPHTCEHLLLGKGTKGRYVASLEDMSLGNSSAFTMQLQTCYHYHTSAGADVFFNLMEAKLDALLHPNYSDEEIRREVCNVGYALDPVDSTLRLEEKGTVYNEMVSTFERPWSNLGTELDHLMYGPTHPLALSSGGIPADIRTMKPEDLRRFQEREYHLNNMGMIVSIPEEITLEDCMKQCSAILKRVEPDATIGDDPATLGDRLPPPHLAPEGTIRQVTFPNQNEKEPGLMVYGWGPTLSYDNDEGYLLELLVDNLAGGQTSNLYRKFIDSQSRVLDVGANSVFGWVSSDPGHAVYVGLNNVNREATEVAMIDSVRTLILGELRTIASYPDNSDELKAFNERARSLVIERRRDLREFLNTPPRFGYRGTGSRWFFHLQHLQNVDGDRKRLTLDDELAFAEKELDSGHNFWKDYISKWGLLERVPYGVATRPDPQMIATTEANREKRLDAYAADLEQQYGVSDKETAVEDFKKDYDKRTDEIENEAKTIKMPSFLDNPPLTLDDQLKFTVKNLPGGDPFVVSTFDNMTSATVGLAFNMDVVPENDLMYVAALPTLLTDVGVIIDGKPVPYDDMTERIRREILGVNARYDRNYRTERVELVLRASGSDAAESQTAMNWLATVLYNPDWRTENLPRIRDAVDQALSNRRNTMRAPEEYWVNDPANAYWRQNNPLLMMADCFLTQTHALHRLRWQLKVASSPEVRSEFQTFMSKLGDASSGQDREGLTKLAAALSAEPIDATASPLASEASKLKAETQTLIRAAAKDLTQNLADIPDGSLASDWKYLCNEMDADLAIAPKDALAECAHVMDLLRHRDNVRGFMIGSTENQNALMPRVQELVERLNNSPSDKQTYSTRPNIVARLQEHEPNMDRPIYVGLVNENTRSGVHINTAPCASYLDRDPNTLAKFLSARLYGGGGAHSMFMKTWGAGLAYSNGLRSNESTGRLIYYAERCPDLAQTMQFVVNELKKAPYDTSLAEYAIAQAFAGYRGGSRYEERGEAMAADLADGVTPQVVKGFREGILRLRDSENLYDDLQNRMVYTYGEVLPGLGPKGSEVGNAIYFVIGPEKQLANYEEYLKSVEGDVTLHRLYPRDYWLVETGS